MTDRPSIFISPVNIKELIQAWGKIKDPSTVYYATICLDHPANRIYIEEMDGYYGHCRVFFGQKEASKYLLRLAQMSKKTTSEFRLYEFTLSAIISTFNRLVLAPQAQDGIRISINTFSDLGELVEIDILWDSKAN